MTALLNFVIIAFIITLVFWQKSVFLYLLAAPAALVYGLTLAGAASVASSQWVMGVVVAVIGLYFIIRAIMIGLGKGENV